MTKRNAQSARTRTPPEVSADAETGTDTDTGTGTGTGTDSSASRGKEGQGDAPARSGARMMPPPRFNAIHAGWVVLAASFALCLIGMYCINLTTGPEPGGWSRFAVRQSVFLVAGLVLAGVMMLPHYRKLVSLRWPLAIATIVALVFVLIPWVPESLVRARKGARRWINVGVTEFQPSEVAKFAFVIVLAGYLRFREDHRRYLGLVRPALIAFVPMALILVEPDLGTMLLFLPALLAMLIAAGAKLWHLVLTGLLGGGFLAVIVGASLVFAQQDRYPLLRPHQVERIQGVIEMNKGDLRHADERLFQGLKARMVIGAGGWAGHSEAKTRALIAYSRLPEQHNDMIFPVFINRFGFVGAAVMLSLYACWALGALWVAGVCKDPVGRLIAVGFAAIITTQAGVNIAMTLGLVPITGMTLPFVSYGGTSLLMGFAMAGLICNIGLRRPAYLWRKSFEFDAPTKR